jgi:hypothetical protein
MMALIGVRRTPNGLFSKYLWRANFGERRHDEVRRILIPRTPVNRAYKGDLAVKCGTYCGTSNGRPVMGLSWSAVKAGAGRGAVGSSDIRYAEHTMIATTGRRLRTVHC